MGVFYYVGYSSPSNTRNKAEIIGARHRYTTTYTHLRAGQEQKAGTKSADPSLKIQVQRYSPAFKKRLKG
jgi:hypothetical protein